MSKYKRNKLMNAIAIIIFGMFLIIYIFIGSGCSFTFNVAADGQPNTIIYKDDNTGKCE